MSASVRVLVAIAIAVPRLATAQTFTVDRHEIGGEGGTDYLTAEPGTNRVFISRGSHVMVVDGATGKVLGDIPNTPRTHGIALVPKWHHGFITNGGDSTVSVFDLQSLAEVTRIRIPAGGLDGIMYDETADRVVLTNHSRPKGTVTTIDPATSAVVKTGDLEDDSPEGAASDGHGTIFVNNEGKNTIQVLDLGSLASKATWALDPCDGPTGIAYDRATNRIFSGCQKTSVVVDAKSGKVVATIANGTGVDALGWDPAERLIYLPAGRDGIVTVAHQDGPDRYTVVATVRTMPGAKTIAVDPTTHTAYLFQPEYGPAPAAAPGARPTRGPVVAAWFLAIRH